MRPVRAHLEAEEPPVSVGIRRFEDEGARAVPEDDRAVAVRASPGQHLGRSRRVGVAEENGEFRVRPREERGMALGADQEHAPVRARPDEGVGDMKTGEKPGALHPDIQGMRGREAEPGGEKPAIAGEVMGRRHRGEDDQVDIFRREPRVVQGPAGRLEAEVARGNAPAREAALFDAGALSDPLVAGVHQARETLVGHDAFGHEHAGASNDGPGGIHLGQIIAGGKLSWHHQ